MTTSLLLDHREGKLKDLFASSSIPHTCENLELGDIQIRHQEKTLFVFERKTIADLLASINDGRYKSQKQRLLQCFEPSQVFYILEGSCPFHATPRNYQDKIVHGSIINTMLRDKISVFFTKNVDETFQMLQCIWKRVHEDPEKYANPSQPTADHGKTTSVVRIKDPSTCYLNQLCQVPDISVKTAEAIIQRFPSMKELYEAFKDKDDTQKLNMLKDITTLDSKGKPRKLSSRVVANLITYMFHDGNGSKGNAV